MHKYFKTFKKFKGTHTKEIIIKENLNKHTTNTTKLHKCKQKS